MSGISNVFYPNVTALPSQGPAKDTGPAKKVPGDFDKMLDQLSERSLPTESLKQPIKFSTHALQRLRERQIEMSPERMTKLTEAIEKADSKGLIDTLVIMDDAAMIVSVKNKIVVTAMDRDSLSGNVFTNIDGAVIV